MRRAIACTGIFLLLEPAFLENIKTLLELLKNNVTIYSWSARGRHQTRSDKQKGGDARMLQKILVVLVSVAIAVRIALDWMQEIKKAASDSSTDDERPEG